jgi:hypothetical protein
MNQSNSFYEALFISPAAQRFFTDTVPSLQPQRSSDADAEAQCLGKTP